MKTSRNWVQEYVNFALPNNSDLVTKIGAQLGGIEGTEDLAAKYVGATVVTVVECSKLENSDHLNLCYVDDNGVTPDVQRREDGLVQVVCGAPNVTAGVLAVWLPPGATVPNTFDHEPFVLEARELRGVVSSGMLASSKELALNDNHEGILLLDDGKPGMSFAEAYGLNDFIIDIENKMFTHRPDCFGQLGVAREVAGIMGQQFTSPDWYVRPSMAAPTEGRVIKQVQVRNEVPELCARYMIAAIENVQVAQSPQWLQSYLTRVGIRPINNIVDMTNYLMVLTGQPLHAFDFDKVSADGESTIVVRNPRSDETITLLDGKTITPRAEAVLICTPDAPIALGGLMGGGNSEIDVNTTRIIIECANFDMYNTRRTSMQHGIFTDAATRFTKGQSAAQCDAVLAKAVTLVSELCPGAQLVANVVDDYPSPDEIRRVPVSADFINTRLGLQLDAETMAGLLRNVEFNVTLENDVLQVTAPFWRTDIELREDVVEEIGRLYGYDALPLVLPRRDITPATKDAALDFKQQVRAYLAQAGANEVLSYSFVHGKLLDNVTQQRDQAFKLSNALSPDLQYYRLHALPSLLDKIHPNIKAGYDEFALFELNKGHNLLHADDAEGGVPTELEFLDFVYASKSPRLGAPYYQAQYYLRALAGHFGLTLSFTPIDEDPHVPVADPYDYTRSAYAIIEQTGEFLGMVGEFKPTVIKSLKLPAYCAGFTIGPEQLAASANRQPNTYQTLPKYPKVEQDICLRVPIDVNYASLRKNVLEALSAHKPEDSRLQTEVIDIYKRPDDQTHHQITFRVSLTSYVKTMTEEEMASILKYATIAAEQAYGAERI